MERLPFPKPRHSGSPAASRTHAAATSDAWKLIGSRFKPPKNEVSIQAGSPERAIESTRASNSRKKTTISILARYIPMEAGDVVASACQRDKVGRGLELTDQAAVDLRRSNQRRHIIGGMG